ncbi:LytR/AlgR family response regulator transcription factor [Reinekea blandensis]|uniref:Transcriptional regulator n=1 Tax=Reinekea blandensis MED297 TaxID=314283 RepID=A4BK03_9GAMM|nr:LytTR family DNA-binding domain-containing protein [Reinekea blandensis]EAR07536.1 transcriptional regulator [Reinekea sp. MED297] [Reinekea blandensis MED297]
MNLLIADDEPLLRFHLQKALENVWPDADIVAQAANGEEALALIDECRPDVAFLDIKMPGLTGLDVALKLAQKGIETRVVFLTAYDDYAVAAFERGAIDYLLKPLDENRLVKTVERLQQLQAESSASTQPPQLDALVELVNRVERPGGLVWLNVQKGNAIKVIAVNEVRFFRAEDKYTTVVTDDDEFLMRMSIRQLEEQLDLTYFWRIHRSTVVNMQHVDRAERNDAGNYEVYILGRSKPLPVSRAHQHLFKAQ